MKKLILLLAALWTLACAPALAREGLSVVAVNFPCYDFVRQVAGDRAEATLLLRPGMEAHSYDPSPADILAIGGADLFVYVGGESDVWVEGMLAGLDGDAPAVLRMMDAVTPLEEEAGEDHSHGAPEYDEHIWTSPKNARAMVYAVADALCAVDPAGEAGYRAAAEEYAGQIGELDAAFEAAAAGAVRRELVFADRFPFLYFVRDYGLDYLAAFPSCTADTEPTPQTLLSLIQRVRKDGVPVVYTIELSTQSVAKAVAEETGAGIRQLHSMQTVTQAEFDAGETYVSLMRKNLEAVREGLGE